MQISDIKANKNWWIVTREDGRLFLCEKRQYDVGAWLLTKEPPKGAPVAALAFDPRILYNPELQGAVLLDDTDSYYNYGADPNKTYGAWYIGSFPSLVPAIARITNVNHELLILHGKDYDAIAKVTNAQ